MKLQGIFGFRGILNFWVTVAGNCAFFREEFAQRLKKIFFFQNKQNQIRIDKKIRKIVEFWIFEFFGVTVASEVRIFSEWMHINFQNNFFCEKWAKYSLKHAENKGKGTRINKNSSGLLDWKKIDKKWKKIFSNF